MNKQRNDIKEILLKIRNDCRLVACSMLSTDKAIEKWIDKDTESVSNLEFALQYKGLLHALEAIATTLEAFQADTDALSNYLEKVGYNFIWLSEVNENSLESFLGALDNGLGGDRYND